MHVRIGHMVDLKPVATPTDVLDEWRRAVAYHPVSADQLEAVCNETNICKFDPADVIPFEVHAMSDPLEVNLVSSRANTFIDDTASECDEKHERCAASYPTPSLSDALPSPTMSNSTVGTDSSLEDGMDWLVREWTAGHGNV